MKMHWFHFIGFISKFSVLKYYEKGRSLGIMKYLTKIRDNDLLIIEEN